MSVTNLPLLIKPHPCMVSKNILLYSDFLGIQCSSLQHPLQDAILSCCSSSSLLLSLLLLLHCSEWRFHEFWIRIFCRKPPAAVSVIFLPSGINRVRGLEWRVGGQVPPHHRTSRSKQPTLLIVTLLTWPGKAAMSLHWKLLFLFLHSTWYS